MRYFLTLTAVAQRFLGVQPLRNRAEIEEHYFDFVSWIDRNCANKLNCSRLDNSADVLALRRGFHWFGIGFETSSPYTPEYYIVTEGMIMTLLRKNKAMMKEAGMKPLFWPEAIQYAAYLHNRTASSALGMIIPYNAIYGNLSSNSETEVFGCTAFQYGHKKNWAYRLDEKSEKGIKLGMRNGMRRIFIWKGASVITTKRVSFDENVYLLRRNKQYATLEGIIGN